MVCVLARLQEGTHVLRIQQRYVQVLGHIRLVNHVHKNLEPEASANKIWHFHLDQNIELGH